MLADKRMIFTVIYLVGMLTSLLVFTGLDNPMMGGSLAFGLSFMWVAGNAVFGETGEG